MPTTRPCAHRCTPPPPSPASRSMTASIWRCSAPASRRRPRSAPMAASAPTPSACRPCRRRSWRAIAACASPPSLPSPISPSASATRRSAMRRPSRSPGNAPATWSACSRPSSDGSPMATSRIRHLRVLLFVTALLAIVVARSAAANPGLTAVWPDPATLPQVVQEDVTIASSSPYLLTDVDSERAPATTVHGTLFLPPGPHAPHSLPAVVMLHGSSGVLAARELTYGKQLAAMGIAVLVVDSFGGRPDRGSSFTERLLNITDTMFVA